MHPELREAHHELDAAIDRLYRSPAFASDRERVERLFGLDEKLVMPLAAVAKPGAQVSLASKAGPALAMGGTSQ
jgi:hypothetical protein